MAATSKSEALAQKWDNRLFSPKPERRQRRLRLHSSTSFYRLNRPVKSSSGLTQAKIGDCCLAIDWGFHLPARKKCDILDSSRNLLLRSFRNALCGGLLDASPVGKDQRSD